jgi:hypothetical protein
LSTNNAVNNSLAGQEGTGKFVGDVSPTLTTPDIGAAIGDSLNLGTSTTIDGFIDDDTFATASATTGATSESIKAYVDNQVADESPWVLLASASPSGVANVDFTDLSTDYFAYKVFIEYLHPDTDGVNLLLLVSTDNGASFINSASAYRVSRDSISTTNSTASGSNAATGIAICLNVGFAGNTEAVWGELQIINPANASRQTTMVSLLNYVNSAGENHANVCAAGRNNAEANNAIRFLFSSGNISAGTIKLYGIRAT